MSRVTTWTEKTELDGSESLALDDGSNKKLLTKRLMIQVDSSATGPNYTVNPDANTIDSAADTSVITGSGRTAFPNKIGAASKPAGTDYTNPATWADDTGYISGAAAVAAICGGYDHINNQQAGTICGGGHNYIQYHSAGHSIIGGGSYNWIESGRSAIFAGTDNRVSGGDYCGVFTGYKNKVVTGAFNTILSGELNTIDAGAYNLLGGSNCTIDTGAQRSMVFGRSHTLSGGISAAIFGGDSNTQTSASYSASIGGQGNTQTGQHSAMLAAKNCNDNGAQGVFSGEDAVGIGAAYHYTIGAPHPTTGVNAQSMRVVQTGVSTGAASNPNSSQFIELDDTKTTTVSGTITVSARNTTDAKSASYKMDFQATWDGTTYLINGASSEPTITTIYEDTGSNITAPKIACNTGSLRVRFGGTSGKTIDWAACFDVTVIQGA